MQIQLSWVRHLIPRGVKPIAKGTNTLVFPGRDNDKVDVFLLCPVKYDWWHQCGIVTNPNEDHFVRHIESKGWLAGHQKTVNLVLRRVQAKKLFRAENGSPQKREIAATVKAMDKIWLDVWSQQPYGGARNQQLHTLWSDFWNAVIETDLPTKDLAYFATDYYVAPDLAPSNALVDYAGDIVWSDLFVSENVLDFVHMRKSQPNGHY